MPQHLVFHQRPPHPGDRLRPILSPGDQLRDQRVVEDRHVGARLSPAVVSDARDRKAHASDVMRPGDGMKPASGSSAYTRHSMAWPRGVSNCSGGTVKPLAARDADLPLHQVDAGDHLGHRMLHLDSRVHLEEVEAARPRRAGTRPSRRWCSRPMPPPPPPRPSARARSSADTTGDGVSSMTF